MIPAQILDLIHQHYPRGLWTESPGYDDTPERRLQMDALRRAIADIPRWNAMLGRLRARFTIDNRSLHLQSGSFDSAYSAMAVIPDEQGQTWDLGFHVSILGPYYVVHRMNRPGEEPVAAAIAQEIEATYGYSPIPPEIGDLVVPDVALDSRDFGEATIYECLLSVSWGGRGPMESRNPLPRYEGT